MTAAAKIVVPPVDRGPQERGDHLLLDGLLAMDPGQLRARLLELAQGATSGEEGHARYHATLYALYERRDMATAARRAWLASEVHDHDEALIAQVEWHRALPLDAFRQHVDGLLSMRGRLGSPMSQYLFDQDVPSREAAATYILHHWYRSRRFYELLIAYGTRLPLDDSGVIFENVAGETGGLPDTRPHPRMLEDLVAWFGVSPSGESLHPAMPSAWHYLNNRNRTVRSRHPAWGHALLYSLEQTTTETHTNIHTMLQRLGAPERARAFHALHMVADAEHANGVWRTGAGFLADLEGQRIFLRSLAEQQRLSRIYFGHIWQEICRNVLHREP